MKRFLGLRLAKFFGFIAAMVVVAGGAAAAAPPIDERQLLDAGFKVLVATNKVQEDWVRGLPAGKIRAMQRTGKKYFIYPDASRNQIYVGGPKEYEAYVQLHPEHRVASAQQAAKDASAYRSKQDAVMRSATARDCRTPSSEPAGRISAGRTTRYSARVGGRTESQSDLLPTGLPRTHARRAGRRIWQRSAGARLSIRA